MISQTPMISSDALARSIDIILESAQDDELLVKVLMNFKARYFAE